MMDLSSQVGIIGGGPLAIELAVALKENGISCLVFEKGQIGQMIFNFPPQTHFFSSAERIAISHIPIQTIDQQKCSREEYLAYLRRIVGQYDLKINTYETVIDIKKIESSKFFQLNTKSAKGFCHYITRFLVIASGGTSHPKLLHIEGEDLPHVSTKLEDPHRYFQKEVLIIGGKNSAVESSLRCFHVGARVTLACRKPQFDSSEIKYWLLPELLGCIKRNEIACIYEVEVLKILTEHVILKEMRTHVLHKVPADFVIKNIGFNADMRLFHKLNIPLNGEDQSPEFNEKTMETPVSGVFALGTVTGGTQKKYQIFIENCHIQVEKILRTISNRLEIKTISEHPVINKFTLKDSERLEE